MNTVKTLLFILTIGILSFGCKKDEDTCSQSDWVGTYEVSSTTDPECVDPDDSEPFVIEKGSTDTTILIDGEEVEIIGCTATEIAFIIPITYKLDGDIITVDLGDCTIELKKK